MDDLRFEKGKKTKMLIIKTALNILFTEGMLELTARNLSEKSGVSKGNLYHHFKSMDEIMEEAFLFIINDNYKSITGIKTDSLYDFLVAIVINSVERADCEKKKIEGNTVVFWEVIMRNEKLFNFFKNIDKDMTNWIIKEIENFIKKELSIDLKNYVINVVMTFLAGTKSYIFFMNEDIDSYKEAWKILAKHLEERILEENK